MRLLRALLACLCFWVVTPAFAYPVTVASCSDSLVFAHAPARPLVNDSNMTQTVLDMGLTKRFAGFGGVRRALDQGVLKGSPEALSYVKAHQIADRYPAVEALLGANPDFYFAGWGFGLSEGTGITPKSLAGLGVPTYVLNESCIRVGKRAPVSMETMYADIRAMGRIFGIEDDAERMIAGFKIRVAAVTARTAMATQRPRVMYCGTCSFDEAPLIIGAEGMPAALIALAGGTNIYPDIPDSYVRVGWESVVARNPEWLLLANTNATHEEIIRYVTTAPALKNVIAVKKRQFVFMTYAERSPSTRNVEFLERLARTLHPELFKS